jgi:hypothetical protein
MTDYAAYRVATTEAGLQYQDFIADLLYPLGLVVVPYSSRLYQHTVGESRTGVEIKLDQKYADTGHLWIEIAEKAHPRDGNYVASGIRRDDNTWLYVIGNYDTVFLFAKRHLQALQDSRYYDIRENGTRTSLGFRLPDAHAHRWAVRVLHPQATGRLPASALSTVTACAT